MLVTLLLLAAAPAPLDCLPVPPEMRRLGDDGVTAYRDGLVPDAKAPRFAGAPADSRLLLKLIWTSAGAKEPMKALRRFMEAEFTFSFGDEAKADLAITVWSKTPKTPALIRRALEGTCKATKTDVTCSEKSDPRVVIEKRDGCWKWTAFVAGD